MVVPFTLVPCCSVGMYYSLKLVFSFFFQLEFPVMFVVERLQCIRGNAVSRTDGCCIPSVISCNVSIFRDLEQHLCVLGLCCKALDVHPWMLGPAHYGRYLNKNIHENLSGIGYRSTLAHMLLMPAKQMSASKCVIGTQDNVLDPSTYMFWLYFVEYWIYMLEFFLLPIVHDKDVNWLSIVLIFLLYNRNLWYVWLIAQHVYVFGLCPPALEQHQRMFGLVRKRFGAKHTHYWFLFGSTRSLCCFIVQCSL